jgi:F-type H+-transporting ATPase subunit delta
LDEVFSRNLAASLHKLLGGQPELEPSVDPQLIGGIVLRVGDTVYDGSVARQLAQVREQMINRSVHEIQSRRDRFRHPGGN